MVVMLPRDQKVRDEGPVAVVAGSDKRKRHVPVADVVLEVVDDRLASDGEAHDGGQRA